VASKATGAVTIAARPATLAKSGSGRRGPQALTGSQPNLRPAPQMREHTPAFPTSNHSCVTEHARKPRRLGKPRF
jgi:hypothetical protein